MNEAEARTWLKTYCDVSRETFKRLEHFVNLLNEESRRQNLVSVATLPDVWARHIVDSAQLIRFAPDAKRWLDLGSGAGFPGLILSLLHRSAAVTMVESRPRRVEFLHRAADVLQLPSSARILCTRLETFPTEPFDAITARAFAPLGKLLAVSHRFSTPETIWILPKGRSAKTELEQREPSWQGDFRVEPSLTEADAGIIVAAGVTKETKTR